MAAGVEWKSLGLGASDCAVVLDVRRRCFASMMAAGKKRRQIVRESVQVRAGKASRP